MATLDQVAAALGQPIEQLLELDHRRLTFAFLGGEFETVVVRDRMSGRILEATLDSTSGQLVDATELRRQDGELSTELGSRLSPDLRELLLRHPELPLIEVIVSRNGVSDRSPLRAPVREIVALAQDDKVAYIDLMEEPQIRD